MADASGLTLTKLPDASKKKPAKRRAIFADLWCGGGGTSTGATRAMAELGIP